MRTEPKATPFAERLLRWFVVNGRHDLPWQRPRDPYRVWLSEVMLQQTQVATVIPYFQRFLARFPDVNALAIAPLDDVLKHWAGLGYYARARNLHRAAQQILEQHRGEFPADAQMLIELPGVGRSTAGAILAQAFGQRQAILDGNVRRVLARHAGIEGWPGQPKVQAQLWTVAESLLPQTQLADYTQALMDLGNAVCTARAPHCIACPVASDCRALAEQRVHQLPQQRPQRARPHRSAHLVLVHDRAGNLLMEQRPAIGIWGGLWCAPMSDMDETWPSFSSRIGLRESDVHKLAPIAHAFTHFDLDLLPVRVPIDVLPVGVNDQRPQVWIKLCHPADWPGMPAPIRKLVERLAVQTACRSTPNLLQESRVPHRPLHQA